MNFIYVFKIQVSIYGYIKTETLSLNLYFTVLRNVFIIIT